MTEAGRPELQALDLVSQVCGRIAHDLNNLLAAVDGYAEFVAQEVADRPQVMADITEVRSAARKGAAFTRRLRQVGQLMDGAPEPFDISLLVREYREQFELRAGQAVTCEYRLAEGLAPVCADVQHVQLALESLLENAVEAMPDGGTLRVETFEDGGCVALRLADTGRGMDQDAISRLGEPFFSTKPKAIGNGLGMFIVDGVLKRAGGRMEVESGEGAGTSVTLFLPASGS